MSDSLKNPRPRNHRTVLDDFLEMIPGQIEEVAPTFEEAVLGSCRFSIVSNMT